MLSSSTMNTADSRRRWRIRKSLLVCNAMRQLRGAGVRRTNYANLMKNVAHRLTHFALLLLSSGSLAVLAEEPPKLEPLPDAPPPPERVQSGETLEPEVTIIQKEDASVEEYRINNRLYMIKVVPIVGKPYFLLDNNGDGTLETEMSQLYREPQVPHWVLFSW